MTIRGTFVLFENVSWIIVYYYSLNDVWIKCTCKIGYVCKTHDFEGLGRRYLRRVSTLLTLLTNCMYLSYLQLFIFRPMRRPPFSTFVCQKRQKIG